MTWTRLSDDFDETTDALSDAAFRLLVCARVFCNRNLTDGFVPEAKVRRLVPRFRPAALAELEAGGHAARTADGWAFGWSDQRTREQVLVERERNNTRQQRHRHGVTDGVTNGVTNGGPVPVPVPVPVPGGTSKVPRGGSGGGGWDGWDPAWESFREAWEARGFRLPPTEPQRAALWDVVDSRPHEVARWVAEVQSGAKSYEVVEGVLARWQQTRAAVPPDPKPSIAPRTADEEVF